MKPERNGRRAFLPPEPISFEGRAVASSERLSIHAEVRDTNRSDSVVFRLGEASLGQISGTETLGSCQVTNRDACRLLIAEEEVTFSEPYGIEYGCVIASSEAVQENPLAIELDAEAGLVIVVAWTQGNPGARASRSDPVEAIE